MKFLGVLLWAVLVVILSFVFLDSPVRTFSRLAGIDVDNTFTARQANTGLKLALDLKARREGRRVAVLFDDWFYCYPETNQVYVVPRGYETDFASIPALARWVISPFGDHAEGAVIHDWLYAVGHPVESSKPDGERDFDKIEAARLRADKIFRFAMKEQGVNVAKRNLMYQAVRRGGKSAFGRPNEWLDGFKDPESFDQVNPPPIAKPNPIAQFTLNQRSNQTCEEGMTAAKILEWREQLADRESRFEQ